jgi:osmoprotectant transport system substrate-binding protein
VRMTRVIAVVSTMAIFVAACGGVGGGGKADIKIGSDNFYESKLMAEMYAQVLENAGYKVTRNLGLGSRLERQPAFEQGTVDLVPEYVGSGLGYYNKSNPTAATTPTGDGEANKTALQAVLDTKGANGGKLAEVLAITPAQDQNAAVVRPETATSLKLAKMSDLAAVQDQLKWGLPPDCDKNSLCKGALEQYGINYPPKQREALAACDAPIAEALKGKAVDFAWLCSTQPAILVNGFTMLEDDKKTQPADNIAPVVREDYLSKVDAKAFAALLDAVSAKMTTQELLALGVKVAVDNKDVADVAKEWLTANGLLSK